MTGVDMVPATERHARELVAHLSEESLRSVNIFRARDPLTVVLESIRVSRVAEAVSVNGELLFVWGARELNPTDALGWFMTTDAVLRNRRVFWQTTKGIVAALRAKYEIVANIIHPENALTLRWAEAMGFAIHPVQFKAGKGFHRAEIVRASNV